MTDAAAKPLCPAFGLDLGPVGSRSIERLASLVSEAITDHHVVKVSEIGWETGRQLEMTSLLGTIVGGRRPGSDAPHPSVRHERGADLFTDRWHADLSWSSTDAISVLVCTEIGAQPDATLFLDTSAAIADIDADLLSRATGRSVLHDLRHSRRLRPAGPLPSFVDRARRSVRRRADRWFRLDPAGVEPWPSSLVPTVCVPRQQGRRGTRRPLVDRCPRTGVSFLRVGDHAWQVSGLDPSASQVLLGEIHRAIDRPRFVWRQDWQVGDMVVYDNRMVLHRRSGSAGSPPGRVLRRTLAEWPHPLAPGG